jgi:DNA recombination protein RmuC
MLTDMLLLAILAVVAIILVLLILQARKLSELAGKEADWTIIQSKIAAVQQAQEQLDRSVREEISRNRQEQSNQSQALRSEVLQALTGVGDSLSSKVEGLTRSNDQKLELLRSAVEQRLDSFTVESGRKFDGLTESITKSSGQLQQEVSSKLEEFKNSLAETVRETHQLQSDQTERISTTLDTLKTGLDERLTSVQTVIDAKLADIAEKTGQKLSDVETALQSQTKQMREETLLAFGTLSDGLFTTLNQLSQTQKSEMQELRATVDTRLVTLQTAIDTKLADIAEKTGQKLSDVETALQSQTKQMREETLLAFKTLSDGMSATLNQISQTQKNELQELRVTVDTRLVTLQSENEKKLEQMRQTVDEKLQGTLEARLGESFKQVSDRLEQVHRGLGEMQTLAAGVGDLKRVLNNVKTRGTWGEVQLGALLEQMLAPDQYGQNVAISGTGERVEFAIKLPGRDSSGAPVWLPIDAKFPVEDYQRLVEAAERADVEAVEEASKQLESTFRQCAKTLSEKYIKPPDSTDFGILFLSTEGLYAEAIRRVGLADSIQQKYRVVLAGPSTLSALLNSLQMGFRTLAIQKGSSEVWKLLDTVRSEFGKYSDVLARIKKRLDQAQAEVDSAGVRTRVINRKLRDVESTDSAGLLEVEPFDDAVPESRFLVGGADDGD